MSDDASNTGENPEIKPANKRGVARLAAVQALYQLDMSGEHVSEVIADFRSNRLGSEMDGDQYRDADADWFNLIVKGVVAQQLALDPEIHGVLTDDWPLSRIDSTLRAILRAGAFELNDRKDVPTAVIINEYVDIARAFFEEDDEPKLVNAVLDRLARKYRNS
ncbi:MAG: transcription antitermination factor NusB [Rhizobiaceae bacterium]|nr:transcription antitermination factor NusB [Rhizobiaceae bacterium]